MRPAFRRARDGSFRVTLPRQDRELLHSLPSQLHDLLGTDDPSLVRLFPPGYQDDPEAEADYRRLVAESLLDAKRAALSELEAESWLSALESLRLVLGVQLDVTEETYGAFDPTAPDAPALAVYHWLSWLQEELVAALAEALDQ